MLNKSKIYNSEQVGSALLYSWSLLFVLFESNDRYYCIQKTILNGDNLSAQDLKYNFHYGW